MKLNHRSFAVKHNITQLSVRITKMLIGATFASRASENFFIRPQQS